MFSTEMKLDFRSNRFWEFLNNQIEFEKHEKT